ncbi:MAG: DUF4114 domain-containing protein, partial [Pyrinomonadaceae bacterium]|nr:DUF4114 domain-containing protein [Sphingobacteriaceae bacterium]
MKTFHQTILTLSLATISLFTSCQKDISKPDIASGKIPDGFNFETSKKIDVNIRLLSTENEPLTGIIVDINNTTNGETLLRGVSDQNGYFKASVTIPAYIDTLLVNPNNTGLTQDIKTLVVNNALTCVIGGTNGASGNIVMSVKGSNKTYAGSSSIFANTNFQFMGSFSSAGRPVSYLEPVKGVVSANLLTYLAESLPDNKDVRVHHPAYLTDNATEHLNLTKTADVWVTFVSEGGNHANAIGYYTYPTGNPPNMASKIPTVRYIFPNCGGVGSGGAMQSGDRVKLGTFGQNTSIGFVLIQNGWRPNQNTVDSSYPKFYSDSPFNPENTAALKTHTVLLNYAPENLFIIGFEDLVRTGGDHDFNDVVLYANTVPTDAIGTAAVQAMAPPKDTDGDGVWDVNDKFPND